MRALWGSHSHSASPLQVALLLLADGLWDQVQLQWPQVLGKENPFNLQIEQVFGDQGGH